MDPLFGLALVALFGAALFAWLHWEVQKDRLAAVSVGDRLRPRHALARLDGDEVVAKTATSVVVRRAETRDLLEIPAPSLEHWENLTVLERAYAEEQARLRCLIPR